MARIATSIEESKRLLELGIGKNTADMCHEWIGSDDVYSLRIGKCYNVLDIPAWSLGALMELLPNDIAVRFQNGNDEGTLYWVDTFLATTFSDTYIGAVVEMIELLVNEGYIKGKE